MVKRKHDETLPEEEVLNGEAAGTQLPEETDEEPAGATEEATESEASEETALPEQNAKRIREDIALIKELFPALTSKDIPNEVWEKVKAGESLAASYALYFIQSVKEKERIAAVNDENTKKAPPRVKSDKAGEEYFSPETVQGMSGAEVRKHYHAILKSMDSWN